MLIHINFSGCWGGGVGGDYSGSIRRSRSHASDMRSAHVNDSPVLASATSGCTASATATVSGRGSDTELQITRFNEVVPEAPVVRTEEHGQTGSKHGTSAPIEVEQGEKEGVQDWMTWRTALRRSSRLTDWLQHIIT